MIKLKLATSWQDMIEMILEAEPPLSPEDVEFKEGEDEELVRKLSQKLNRNYEQVAGWIESVTYTTTKAS